MNFGLKTGNLDDMANFIDFLVPIPAVWCAATRRERGVVPKVRQIPVRKFVTFRCFGKQPKGKQLSFCVFVLFLFLTLFVGGITRRRQAICHACSSVTASAAIFLTQLIGACRLNENHAAAPPRDSERAADALNRKRDPAEGGRLLPVLGVAKVRFRLHCLGPCRSRDAILRRLPKEKIHQQSDIGVILHFRNLSRQLSPISGMCCSVQTNFNGTRPFCDGTPRERPVLIFFFF